MVGKLQAAGLSDPGPAESFGSLEKNFTERVGKLANRENLWDNGLYTSCCIFVDEFLFLIDNGSSATLLSKNVCDKLDKSNIPLMIPVGNKMLGANGQEIQIFGKTTLPLSFGKAIFYVDVIVCDIIPDGILGQDFLLKHASRIDYKSLNIITEQGSIKCWIGGEAEARSRVLTLDNVHIPPMSSMNVGVRLEESHNFPELALIMAPHEAKRNTRLLVAEGIVETKNPTLSVRLINPTEEAVHLPQNVPVGICESLFESHIACQQVYADPKSQEELPDHLVDLLERSSTYLDNDQKQRLSKLLYDYQHVFAKSSEDLGRTEKVVHKINTGSAKPIKQPPRRQPLGKRDIEKEEIQKMLKKGVIEPSSSSWASPVVLVTKKDGSTRFCVDYRKLNDCTVKDAYPIPRVDECLDALAGSKWFSCMDLNSGFWQIGLDKNDKEKTSFATGLGLYQFTVMPFGLVNAPSTFERLMEDVMRGLQWEECLVYMDDLIVPSQTFDEGLVRLEHVFKRLETANLKLKPSKCVFFQKQVNFLGHIVSENGVSTDPEKTEAIKTWSKPSSKKQMRSFLGLCSYYRKFVKNFAAIAKPLHKLCEKKTPFLWSDEAQAAFEKLKSHLVSSPILAYPELGKKFILDTDASEFAVGAVLSQEHEKQERVIAYMSKSLNAHERAYCVTRKELLAVVTALKKFHIYLYGQEVLLRTDNSAVSWMKNLKTSTGQMARWLQELGTYNLIVTHRKGKKHSNADALSRKPCKICQKYTDSETEIVLEDSTQCHEEVNILSRAITVSNSESGDPEPDFWHPDTIRSKQMNDDIVGFIFQRLLRGDSKPEWREVADRSPKLKTLLSQWDRLLISSSMLYRKWETQPHPKLQLVVPKDLQTRCLEMNHDIPSSGHLGWKRTLERISESYYWPGVKTDIQKYCESCDTCAARKASKTKRAPLGQLLTGAPMEKISMDILGPLPLTPKGNKYILVMVDEFTKWTEAIPMPNQEASTVAKLFVDEFISRFGVPLEVHTDQGRNFESSLFKQMCDLFRIHKTRTTSFRPQANGTVERFNRTLTNMLTAYCSKTQNLWDNYLSQVMMAYRSTTHSSTKMTPNMMVLGYDIYMPSQAFLPRPEAYDSISIDEHVKNLQEALADAHDTARKFLREQSIYRKKIYDRSSKSKEFKLHSPI